MNWWVDSIKNACATLNYIEYFLILASAITGLISDFTSLLGIPIGIAIYAKGLNYCAIAAKGLNYCAIAAGTKNISQ